MKPLASAEPESGREGPTLRRRPLLWMGGVAAVALAAAAAGGVHAVRHADGRAVAAAWAARAEGLVPVGLGLEPIREAVQVWPGAWPALPLADVPAGWPVIAATRSVPHWRSRAALAEPPR